MVKALLQNTNITTELEANTPVANISWRITYDYFFLLFVFFRWCGFHVALLTILRWVRVVLSHPNVKFVVVDIILAWRIGS